MFTARTSGSVSPCALLIVIAPICFIEYCNIFAWVPPRALIILSGATLIDNPISKAPGFRIENMFVMAGVPRIFAAMLDHVMMQVEVGEITVAKSVTINKGESHIAEPLAQIAQAYPELSIGSYPQGENGNWFVEVVVKGLDEAAVDACLDEIVAAVA